MKKVLSRLLVVTILIVSFLIAAPLTQGADSYYYPSQTPQTTVDPTKFASPYTSVTVDVSPKLNVIPVGTEQTWTVVVTYMVTAAGSGKVNLAAVRELELSWDNNLDSGYSISTPQGGVIDGPTETPGNKWDVTVSKSSGYFNEGVVFVLTFEITTPDSLAPGIYTLVKTFHRAQGNFSGQESSSSYGIVIRFNVGPNHTVPEVPVGSLIAAASMIAACAGYFVIRRRPSH